MLLILEDMNKKSQGWVQQPHPQWGHSNPWLHWEKEFPVVSMTLDRRALGITGNGNDGLLWYWDSHLVFTWCHWLWNHGDGTTCKNPPVLLSCTYVGDMVSLVLSACCSFVWISCSISVVSTMLPFAVHSRRLISLMLFGCQIGLAYSRTGVTTAL